MDRGLSYPKLSLLLAAELEKDKRTLEEVKQIDPLALIQEIDRLEEDFSKRFLKNERDREIFSYYKAIELLKRLNGLELTSSEYEVVKGRIPFQPIKKERIGWSRAPFGFPQRGKPPAKQLGRIRRRLGGGHSPSGLARPHPLCLAKRSSGDTVPARPPECARDHPILSFLPLQLLSDVGGTPVDESEKKLKTEELAQFIAHHTKRAIVLSKHWEGLIQSALRFYEISHERDSAIEARLEEFLENRGEKMASSSLAASTKIGLKKFFGRKDSPI